HRVVRESVKEHDCKLGLAAVIVTCGPRSRQNLVIVACLQLADEHFRLCESAIFYGGSAQAQRSRHACKEQSEERKPMHAVVVLPAGATAHLDGRHTPRDCTFVIDTEDSSWKQAASAPRHTIPSSSASTATAPTTSMRSRNATSPILSRRPRLTIH